MQPEYIDFHLKSTPQILTFLQLSGEDKSHAIELGIKFLNMGNDQLQGWNNEQWNAKLLLEKGKHQRQVDILKQSVVAESNKQRILLAQHNSELHTLSKQIREQVKVKYEFELNELKEKLERNDKKLLDSNKENRELYKQAYIEFEVKMNEKETKYENKIEKLRLDYDKKLQDEKKEKEALITSTQNSTLIGQAGEDFTFHELNKRFPCAEIEDTHKQPGRGDFIFKENGFCMLIETKNYTKNVKKNEIDKFYRDIEINHDIQCGLFTSIKSGICAREDFQLEVRSGKPIIFLHNISKNIHNIELAVTLFKLILKTGSIDLTCKEVVDKIKICIPIIKRNWNKMRQQIQKFERGFMECVSDQEAQICSIFELLSLKY
jgi:hypothetical protein